MGGLLQQIVIPLCTTIQHVHLSLPSPKGRQSRNSLLRRTTPSSYINPHLTKPLSQRTPIKQGGRQLHLLVKVVWVLVLDFAFDHGHMVEERTRGLPAEHTVNRKYLNLNL